MRIARLLHDLTKKEEPFQWEKPQQTVFDTPKEHFTTTWVCVCLSMGRVFAH